jgi:hypothetical protein
MDDTHRTDISMHMPGKWLPGMFVKVASFEKSCRIFSFGLYYNKVLAEMTISKMKRHVYANMVASGRAAAGYLEDHYSLSTTTKSKQMYG